MVWNGYLVVGGVEIGNNARTIGYSQSGDCPIFWLRNPGDCETLEDALLHGPYTQTSMVDAPWWDEDIPDLSSRFLGVYIVSMDNIQDSTRSAQVVERLGNGGRIGRVRRATRGIRVRAILTAKGDDALELGSTWLDAALSADACSSHGSACGVTDMEFFGACPPVRPYIMAGGLYPATDLFPATDLYPSADLPGPLPDDQYTVMVDEFRRFFHDVACTSGPFVVQEFHAADGIHVGKEVEFTLTAEVPWMFGVTREISLPPLTPTIAQDVVYNLAPYPSAEASTGVVVVSKNLIPNPSLETNATGWGYTNDGGTLNPGDTGFSQGRSNDVAYDRAWSYRVRGDGSALPNDSSQVLGGYITTPIADLTGLPARSRLSATVWGAIIRSGGPAGPPQPGPHAELAFVGSATTVFLGAAPATGGVMDETSIPIPSGATGAFIRIYGSATVYGAHVGSGAFPASDVRLYADAAAITTP